MNTYVYTQYLMYVHKHQIHENCAYLVTLVITNFSFFYQLFIFDDHDIENTLID